MSIVHVQPPILPELRVWIAVSPVPPTFFRAMFGYGICCRSGARKRFVYWGYGPPNVVLISMRHRFTPDARSGPGPDQHHPALIVLSDLYRRRSLRIRFGGAWCSASRAHRCSVSQLVLGQLGKRVAVMTTNKQGQRDQRPQVAELRCHSVVKDLGELLAEIPISTVVLPVPRPLGAGQLLGLAPDGKRGQGVVTGLCTWLLEFPITPAPEVRSVTLTSVSPERLRQTASLSLLRDLQRIDLDLGMMVIGKLLLDPPWLQRFDLLDRSVRGWAAHMKISKSAIHEAKQRARMGGSYGN